MAVLIVAMMAATVLEKVLGTPFAFRWVYHNPLFFILWAVAAFSGISLLLSGGKAIKFRTLLIHLSFVIILSGALVSHFTGKQGSVKLTTGSPVSEWTSNDGKTQKLPCPLVLEDFEVLYYSGSRAASDYRSMVRADGRLLEISMNNIGRVGGYRFYQSGFDGESSILTVNYDPFGITITYLGYALLLISLLGFFSLKNSYFKTALRRVVKSSAFLLAVFFAQQLGASTLPKALPKDVSDAFGELYVYYNDRVCPFETMARDYSMKAYGKPGWKDYDACQVVTGWLFYYEWWTALPFKLNKKDIGTPKEAEKEFLLRSVASGDAWKIYPVADSSGIVTWYDSNEMLPVDVVKDYDRWVFIRKVMDVVERSVRAEEWDEVKRIVGRIRDYQVKVAGNYIPTKTKVRAETLYNRISRPMIPFMVSISWGVILFAILGFCLSRNRKFPCTLAVISAYGAMLIFLYLTTVLALRWYVSGHAPFAGSYSVMMLMAWISTFAISLLWKKSTMILPPGFILAGFTMLMASMAGANPQITPLMPVLQSPLLSIHVLTMMLSYTMLGLLALNGIMGLLVPYEASARLQDVGTVILYPAVFLLIAGTFLGAVWANISWGNYWSWDPKETWALVTFLIYSFALHGKELKPMRRPRLFHLFCVLAFLSVLVTYFGVNLLLGGMHSYA